MSTQFFKKSLFAKVISFIIVANFILTSGPISAYGSSIATDTLRRPAATESSASTPQAIAAALRSQALSERIIVSFSEIGKDDVAIAGGKGANLGELQHVPGISVPPGVAITTKAFQLHIDKGKVTAGLSDAMTLREFIAGRLQGLNYDNSVELAQAGEDIRKAIETAVMPQEVEFEIRKWYQQLCDQAGVKDLAVAIRSSATAEDLPDASFAGQQDTYLNIRGIEAVLDAVRRNWASLFTDRAIFYRNEQKIDHATAYISVVIQQMANNKVSGTAFTVHTDTGFPVFAIDAAWGLGEGIVSGAANPDSFVVRKDSAGRYRIYRRTFGKKLKKVVYRKEENLRAKEGTELVDTSYEEQHTFSLTDEQIFTLVRAIEAIHNHYGRYMDIEWGFDVQGKLWILQSRSETSWNKWEKENPDTAKFENTVVPEAIADKAQTLLRGVPSSRAAAGRVVIVDAKKEGLELARELDRVKKGDILVTTMTKPDMVPAMKRAGAIVTDEGGPTCHAAIVARELEVPCIVGTGRATKVLKDGMEVTVDGNRGRVYAGLLKIEELRDNVYTPDLPKTKTKIGIIVANPFSAMKVWQLSKFASHYGVGLLRKEFADTTEILIHPLAGLAYDMYNDPSFKDEKQRQWIKERIIDNVELRTAIEETINGYSSFAEFFKDKLANTLALIAAAQVEGQKVIFRTTDFKTNEYKNQIGGPLFEPEENNPMMGYRGINRMLSEAYKRAFELEIEAVKKARELQKNIVVMFPVVRTPQELKQAVDLFAQHGLVRGQDGFQVYMMVEVPANVFQAAEFYQYVDGMSIGSNDMTQFVLGLGRDNEKMRKSFDEANPAVKKALEIVIKTGRKFGITTGLCGQRPSNDPAFAALLVQAGIDSISVVPEAYKNITKVVAKQEKELEGIEFNPQIAGWQIPEKNGQPQPLTGQEVDASAIIKGLKIHPMILMVWDKLSPAERTTNDILLSKELSNLTGKTAHEYVFDKVYNAIMQKSGTTPSDIPLIYTTDDLDKTEYESLLGSNDFELFDENPQLGFCGLARVVDGDYREFLRWQLEAIKKARDDSGRKNIWIRLDLARTLPEVNAALEIMKQIGLVPGKDGFKVGMEIAGPANVLLIDEFIKAGIGFLSENNTRFLSYDMALDPGSPYVDYPAEAKEAALRIPRRVWTNAAEINNIPLVQFEGEFAAAQMPLPSSPSPAPVVPPVTPIPPTTSLGNPIPIINYYQRSALEGKRILLRVDFNVSDEQGNIKDVERLVQAIPTIAYLINNGATVILTSHNGRPAGQIKKELSMGPVAVKLNELLKAQGYNNINVVFHEGSINDKGLAEGLKNKIVSGAINVLENTRFYSGEEKNDEAFARGLADLADNYMYVFDAFGTGERVHASTGGAAKFMDKAAIGFLVQKEYQYLEGALGQLYGIIIGGGPKVSEKVPVVMNVVKNIRRGGFIIIGSGPVAAFLKLHNIDIGQKPSDKDMADAKEIISLAQEKGVGIWLPSDFIATDINLAEVPAGETKSWLERKKLPGGTNLYEVNVEQLRRGTFVDNRTGKELSSSKLFLYDIGPNSAQDFVQKIKDVEKGNSVFWNGSVGVDEMAEFQSGAQQIARALSEATGKGVTTVVGGGDTVASTKKFNARVSHASTGGGASLVLLQGKKLAVIGELENIEIQKYQDANKTSYTAMAGEDFGNFVSTVASDLGNKPLALIVTPEFFRISGINNTLKELEGLSSIVKVGLYGEKAEKIKGWIGNKEIITANSIEELLEALAKMGIDSVNTIVLRAPRDTANEAALRDRKIRQVVSGDIATLAVAKTVKELVGTDNAQRYFIEFLSRIIDNGVIEPISAESRQRMIKKLEEGTFAFPEEVKVTNKVDEDTKKARLIIEEFMDRV